MCVIAVAIGILASAYDCGGGDYGVVSIGRTNGGVIAEQLIHNYSGDTTHYESRDGGLTWRSVDSSNVAPIEWGGTEVTTPRGRYRIDDTGVLLISAAGQPETAYSTAYLREPLNLWLQSHKTRGGSRL